jgi:hypothetical protein
MKIHDKLISLIIITVAIQGGIKLKKVRLDQEMITLTKMLTAMFACRLVRELKNIHKNIIKIQGL